MRDRIADALKDAMRSRDATRVSTLRLILATLKDREIAARGDGEEGSGEDEAVALSILAKMVKQREDSIRGYEEGGRLELAAEEQREIDVIREFMPQPMSQAEVDAAVDEAIAETEAEGLRDMGRVIGTLKARHPGRIDFGKVGAQVKNRLA